MGFINVAWINNNVTMIIICWNTRIFVIVFINNFAFWLLILDKGIIVAFSSVFIITVFANSSIFQVVALNYFNVTCITKSIYLIHKAYLQNNQKRPDQNRTELNRTVHIKQNKFNFRF